MLSPLLSHFSVIYLSDSSPLLSSVLCCHCLRMAQVYSHFLYDTACLTLCGISMGVLSAYIHICMYMCACVCTGTHSFHLPNLFTWHWLTQDNCRTHLPEVSYNETKSPKWHGWKAYFLATRLCQLQWGKIEQKLKKQICRFRCRKEAWKMKYCTFLCKNWLTVNNRGFN